MLQINPEKTHNRKVTVYYPISRQIAYQYNQPCYYAIKGDRHEQLETTIVNEKLMPQNIWLMEMFEYHVCVV